MNYSFCQGSILFHEKMRKRGFLHYIEFFNKRLRNDYAFLKNAACFYQKSALTAEDGLMNFDTASFAVMTFDTFMNLSSHSCLSALDESVILCRPY